MTNRNEKKDETTQIHIEEHSPLVADLPSPEMVEGEVGTVNSEEGRPAPDINLFLMRALTVVALIGLFIFGVLTFIGLNSATNTPNTPEPLPAPVEEETASSVWDELLELREHPTLQMTPLFTCSTSDGIHFLNSEPEHRQLFSPTTSLVELEEGGVSVDFGDPECLQPVITPTVISDEQAQTIFTEAQELGETYGLPQPTSLEDGRYLVQPLFLLAPEGEEIRYGGVGAVAQQMKTLNKPNGSTHNPLYIEEAEISEVANILTLLSYFGEDSLKGVEVDDSVLETAVAVLNHTIAETARLA